MMNKQFNEYVTDKSFVLTLSKGQVNCLVHLKNKDLNGMVADSRFMMHVQALQRRGLVFHDKKWNPPAEYLSSGDSSWKITKAGELVFELLVEAGMVNKSGCSNTEAA